jgi:UDP-N-acetylmuramate: L-alanyl-gamma-D-glutamyl-meso-diaminopimelate ligase
MTSSADSSQHRRVHFVGICGTAMASTAVALQERGYQVTGSDQNVYPPMSTFLADRGIPVMEGYRGQNIPEGVDRVVIGNAISRGNPEAEAVLERRIRFCSLPELLREEFLWGRRNLVVTGTHGKTTTASLLAWVLESAGLQPSYLIGGIPRNFGQGARFTGSEWFVLEGDEYDTAFFDKRSKFVHYLPEVAIINNLEFDHADIFDNLAAIQRSFSHFARLVPRNGLLLVNGDEPNLRSFHRSDHYPVKRFGLGQDNEVVAARLSLDADASGFSVGESVFRVPLTGELNVRNALAVVACARHCGVPDPVIQKGLETFTGVARRMDLRGEQAGVAVVDDFGHHPTAIRETLRALRIRYPGRRIWALFEPRSNTTRRNVFQAELAEALERADCIVVSEVARLEQLPPAERLDPARLMEQLRLTGRPAAYLPNVEAIVRHVVDASRPGDVVCVFSNGGFGGIHARLLEQLAARS